MCRRGTVAVSRATHVSDVSLEGSAGRGKVDDER